MANKNYGKEWEEQFKHAFMKTFPGEFILRLKDNTTRYKKASRNPCDFICHIDGIVYMVETKCHYGNTFPFSDLRQFDDLSEAWGGLKDVKRCVVIWMIDHSLVLCAPISEIEKMKQDGLKSINVKTFKEYNIIELDSCKKRVFLDVDCTKMKDVEDL